MTGPENAAGAQSGAREFRLSEHSPSQRSDCPPDCCPEPKRQEQDHDQSWPFIHPRMGSTLLKRSDRRPIVCGVCGPGQNFALQHFPLPPSLISHWLMIYSGASKRRPQIALSWRATTACVGLSFGAGNLAIGQAGSVSPALVMDPQHRNGLILRGAPGRVTQGHNERGSSVDKEIPTPPCTRAWSGGRQPNPRLPYTLPVSEPSAGGALDLGSPPMATDSI